MISRICRNAGLHRSVFPGLIFPPIASSCLLQTMKTLTGTKQSVENARQAFSYSSARPREVLSANFPYSLDRMCKSIPTVRIQSRPLTYIFKFLNPIIIQFMNLHCCGPAVTSLLAKRDRPCPVTRNFMEERGNAVTLRCRDGPLK